MLLGCSKKAWRAGRGGASRRVLLATAVAPVDFGTFSRSLGAMERGRGVRCVDTVSPWLVPAYVEP